MNLLSKFSFSKPSWNFRQFTQNHVGLLSSKDVEPYSIVGGVPAKLIRKRFSPDQIIFLNKIKWWDKDFEWLEQNAELLLDIEIFMNSYNEK